MTYALAPTLCLESQCRSFGPAPAEQLYPSSERTAARSSAMTCAPQASRRCPGPQASGGLSHQAAAPPLSSCEKQSSEHQADLSKRATYSR